jgi:hypothetical protein
LVLTFLLLTFWSASGRSDSFLRSFLAGAAAAAFTFLGLTAASLDSRFDLRNEEMKRKMRNPWMVKATMRPSMPRVEWVLPIPVKKVRKERTRVEKAVMRKMMLLKTRPRIASWD